MEDHPAQAFRRKKDSSVHVAARLVKEGQGGRHRERRKYGRSHDHGEVHHGHAGVGRSCGAGRSIPECQGRRFRTAGCRANVDSKPEHLLQFGVMGEIYYRLTFGSRKPRVGLLSVGEEEIKGNELTRAVYERFKALPVHFVGNVEGGDLFSGKVDVIVCDGFVGNIALKICEGLAMEIIKYCGRLTKALSHRKWAICFRKAR